MLRPRDDDDQKVLESELEITERTVVARSRLSLETSGFEMAEIDVRIESLTGDPTPEGDPADVFPRVPDQQPTSQAGDLWLLGRHRILCLARRALFCVTENSQDPSQPIRPIIGRTTAVVLVPKRPALRMGLFKNGARAGR